MELPFRRKSADASVAVDEPEVPSVAGAKTKAYTPSKRELGVTTPKRKGGTRVVEPAPANRREAVKRAREKQRESRAEQRAGMMAGKEEYLLPRDKGPERRLVRDIVDSRRNAASYFLPGALIVVFGSSGNMPASIRLAANLFWVVLALAVIIDSFILTRKVRRLVTERFPKSSVRPRSLYFYAIMRSLNFRKLRMPSPQVKVGESI